MVLGCVRVTWMVRHYSFANPLLYVGRRVQVVVFVVLLYFVLLLGTARLHYLAPPVGISVEQLPRRLSLHLVVLTVTVLLFILAKPFACLTVVDGRSGLLYP